MNVKFSSHRCSRGRINGRYKSGTRDGKATENTLRRIMVPVDLSCCSAKALRYAVSLARDYGARIIVLNVLDQPLPRGASNRRENQIHKLIREESGGFEGVTVTITTGDPLREIMGFAKSQEIDLLVISTHARGYLPDFCLRSGAEQIVRYAPCPVLVVRDVERDFVFDKKPEKNRSQPKHPTR